MFSSWTMDKRLYFCLDQENSSFRCVVIKRQLEEDLKQITLYLCLAREFYHHHC